MRLRHRQRSAGSCRRAPSTADSPVITPFRRRLGSNCFQEAGAASLCRLAEIIGVALDGDAPSAPAGIPTCRNAAFVSAPAGIFLSSHHRAADLIRFRLRYLAVAADAGFSLRATASLNHRWAPGFKLRRRSWRYKQGLDSASPGLQRRRSGRIHGEDAPFMCRISAWQAWRTYRRCP